MAKRGFLDGYKTYDTSTGFGSISEIGKLFDAVMGVEEAAQVLGDDNPIKIMGFTKMPTMDALKAAYRRLILIHHPDRGGTHAMAQKIIAAYSLLEDRIRRANSRA